MYIMYPRYFFPPHSEICFDRGVQQSAPGLHHSSVASAPATSGTWVPSMSPALSCAQQDTQMVVPAVLSSQRNFSGRHMQRDCQAREGAVQRLSLACLHHLWSSPAGDSQVHPLGALLSADMADVPCSGVPATSPDTLRSLSTGVTQPHCFWWLDLPHPAGSHPNSWSPLQSWHSCPLHGHGIHAAMGHVPFLECSRPKQESLHFEVTGVAQDQLLQHREVPPGPAG